jgi:dTDP-4-dehydrorhamnose 3,5-epimerase
MVEARELRLPGLFEITPPKFGDDRGFFSETWNKAAVAAAGIQVDFVQDNHSFSAERGVLRGLHLQLGPHAQDKLVRVTRGAVWDVAVDIRPGSATLGQWAALEISANRWNQLFVPKGFAHGFVTTEPSTEVVYKVGEYYAPEWERTIAFDDPGLAIPWPVDRSEIRLSAKDRDGLSFEAALALVRHYN